MQSTTISPLEYADLLAIQMRKGYLAYCALAVCSREPVYTSDIIARLHSADLVVVEGTIYPLLSRLQKDGMLSYAWQESEQGPPRKYYRLTPLGHEVLNHLAATVTQLGTTIANLSTSQS